MTDPTRDQMIEWINNELKTVDDSLYSWHRDSGTEKVRGILEAIRDLIQSSAPSSGDWQPMETAPKDRYLLFYGEPWSEGAPSVAIGRWEESTHDVWEFVDSETQKRVRITDGWFTVEMNVCGWMPLPSAPKE